MTAKLVIEEDRHTPRIVIDPDKGVFEITGKSFPEDSKQFYRPVFEWLEKNAGALPRKLDFKFNLFYLSSSSIIAIKQLLFKLKEFQQKGVDVRIVWCYDPDDDDIRKTGEDYVRLTQLNFDFVANND
jgi:hypothetical protein